MSNLKVASVPTDLGTIPSNRTDFIAQCNTDRIKWLEKVQVQGKGDVTPTYGNTQKLTGEFAYQGSMQEEDGMFQDNGNKGWKVTATNGNAHQSNIEIKHHSEGARWMPASLFNGMAMEVHQNSSSKHAMWCAGYALIWINNTSPNAYRFVGETIGDGHDGGPYNGYRYVKFNNSTYINQIRNFGANWFFFGLILHVKNNGGAGSDNSTVKCWNMKMFHKGQSSSSSNHRIIVPGVRPLEDRGNANRIYKFT